MNDLIPHACCHILDRNGGKWKSRALLDSLFLDIGSSEFGC